MKKTTILLALLIVSGAASAQKAVPFKIKLLPKHTYKMTNNMDMDMKMKLPDSLAKVANMPPDGMNFKMKMFQGLNTKTGAKEADGSFPYEMKYDSVYAKASMNNMEQPMPSSIKTDVLIKGKCSADGKMHIDTMASTDPQTQKAAKEMINKLMDQIKFPDKAMAVGESFTQDVPFNMPLMGQNSEMNMKCTYKLTAVKGNQAFFDMAMKMNMDIANLKAADSGMSLKGDGQGLGKMVYLIDKNYAVSQNGDFDMHMDMLMSTMNMHMDMKVKYDTAVAISAN